MRGVMFNKKHSYWDWGLMLKSAPVISPPEPKTKYVDIPGMDGEMDLSESLAGTIRYKNRRIDLEFIVMADREDWPAIYSEILEMLHGKSVDIAIDEDLKYHYTGRVTVGEPRFEYRWIVLQMSANVGPYKTSIQGVKRL